MGASVLVLLAAPVPALNLAAPQLRWVRGARPAMCAPTPDECAVSLPAPSWVPPKRKEIVARLEEEEFDVVVVGGGAVGSGVAMDAASRGLKVGLIEKNDFASGTSC